MASGGGNDDWTKGNVEIGLDIAGKIPKPTTPWGDQGDAEGDMDFAYALAYFLVDTDSSDGVEAATLVDVGGPGGRHVD